MKTRLISVLLMALFTTLFACKKSEITPAVIAVQEVTMSPTTASLVVGSTTQLTAAVAPESATNKAVSWTSDKKEIATVDAKGVVTAVAAGTATITVTTENGTKTATCVVTVTAKVVAVEGVQMSKSATTILVGTTETLLATILPAGATNDAVSWTSSADAVATVDGNGVVKAVAPGTATITVTSNADNAKFSKCEVEVVNYVVIDNLKWTTGNLVANGTNGCKVGAPTDDGLYFHFGSLVGWSGGANGDGVGTGSPGLAVQVKPSGYSGSTSWPAGYYTGGTAGTGSGLPATDDPTTGIGDPCRYYLGDPWRTPTATQWLTLLGADGANTNIGLPLTVNGTALSFPASGYRSSSDGMLSFVGTAGRFWSSSVKEATFGYNLYFRDSDVTPQNYAFCLFGYSVRCVSEV